MKQPAVLDRHARLAIESPRSLSCARRSADLARRGGDRCWSACALWRIPDQHYGYTLCVESGFGIRGAASEENEFEAWAIGSLADLSELEAVVDQ